MAINRSQLIRMEIGPFNGRLVTDISVVEEAPDWLIKFYGRSQSGQKSLMHSQRGAGPTIDEAMEDVLATTTPSIII